MIYLLILLYLLFSIPAILFIEYFDYKVYGGSRYYLSKRENWGLAGLVLVIWPTALIICSAEHLYNYIERKRAAKLSQQTPKVRIDLIKKVAKQQEIDQDPDFIAAMEEIENELRDRNSRYTIK